ERPGRLRVDDEFEFGRLQDRQVGGLRALEDLTGIDADLTPRVQKIGPIAHQQARFGHLSRGTTRGNPVARPSVANWTRPAARDASPAIKRASARSRTMVAKAASISRLALGWRTRICKATAPAEA